MIHAPFSLSPSRAHDRLPSPYRDEQAVLADLIGRLPASLSWPDVMAAARPWVQAVREKPAPFWAMESPSN